MPADQRVRRLRHIDLSLGSLRRFGCSVRPQSDHGLLGRNKRSQNKKEESREQGALHHPAILSLIQVFRRLSQAFQGTGRAEQARYPALHT
jgi:hypothetical protein